MSGAGELEGEALGLREAVVEGVGEGEGVLEGVDGALGERLAVLDGVGVSEFEGVGLVEGVPEAEAEGGSGRRCSKALPVALRKASRSLLSAEPPQHLTCRSSVAPQ